MHIVVTDQSIDNPTSIQTHERHAMYSGLQSIFLVHATTIQPLTWWVDCVLSQTGNLHPVQ